MHHLSYDNLNLISFVFNFAFIFGFYILPLINNFYFYVLYILLYFYIFQLMAHLFGKSKPQTASKKMEVDREQTI